MCLMQVKQANEERWKYTKFRCSSKTKRILTKLNQIGGIDSVVVL